MSRFQRECVLVVALAGILAGCAETSPPAPSHEIDPAGLRLIDESKLDPLLVSLIDQASTVGVAGRPISDYSEAAALADKLEHLEHFDDYEFHLPLSKPARDRMYPDELIHSPVLTIRVDRESGTIVRFRLWVLVF